MSVGDRVKLDSDRRWWTVRASTADVVVLSRQAEFRSRGTLVYTVIDWRVGVRGPVNVIGQGWDVEHDERCRELADDVQRGKWEVSRRNWLSVEVRAVRNG